MMQESSSSGTRRGRTVTVHTVIAALVVGFAGGVVAALYGPQLMADGAQGYVMARIQGEGVGGLLLVFALAVLFVTFVAVLRHVVRPAGGRRENG